MSAQPPAAPGPQPPLPDPAAMRCPRCSATVGPDQDWCLECGAPARTRLAQTPNWQLPTVAIGAIILLAGAMLAFAFVRLTDDGDAPAAAPATATTPVTTPAAVIVPTTATPPATTAPAPIVPTTSTPGPVTTSPGQVTTSPGQVTTSPGQATAPTTTPAPATTPEQTRTQQREKR